MSKAEPERDLIRRILPYAFPAAAAVFVIGTLLDDVEAGWSATIGVGIVTGNFVAHGVSMSWAAAISPILLYAVGLGGFVIRLGVIVAIIALLDQTSWFSVVAFIAAIVPTTIVLLLAELKLVSGRMQAEMWSFPADPHEAHR